MEEGNFDVRYPSQCLLLFIYEFIGTTILLLGVNFSDVHPIIVPCGVFMGAMIVGKKTGGHFNFGVTMGIYIMKWNFRRHFKALCIYFFAELLGAFFGMFISWCYLGNRGISVFPSANGALQNVGFVFFVEFFFTFCFHSMIMHAKNEKVAIVNNAVVGTVSVVVGMYFAITCSVGLSGAALNPSIGIANLVFVAIVKDTTAYLKFLPAFFFGPLLGGAFAGILAGHISPRFTP